MVVRYAIGRLVMTVSETHGKVGLWRLMIELYITQVIMQEKKNKKMNAQPNAKQFMHAIH